MAEPNLQDDEALRREAHHWVVRLTSGAATDADAWQLSAWRDRSPAHEAAYRDAVHLWKQLAPVADRQQLLDRMQRKRRAAIHRRMLIGGAALAASGAGLFFAGDRLHGDRLHVVPSLAELTAEYRTGTGEQRRLTLEDGSAVEMNTRTSLSVRFNEAERRIELAGGEATFTVSPNPARPFVVAAAGGETRALGTVFDVQRKSDEVCVTCLEGKVQVRRINSVELQSAEQVVYSGSGLHRPRSVDPELIASWRRGVLVFRDEPLRQVVGELNRYRPGLIVLAAVERADQRVSGVFHLDRLEEVLTQIERIGGFRSLSLPGRVVILR